MILNAASFYVSMSLQLPSGKKKKKKNKKETLFLKIKKQTIPIKISSLSILSDSYTSKNMLGTSNFWYGGIFKAIKKTC